MKIDDANARIRVETERAQDGSWRWQLLDSTGAPIRSASLAFSTRELAEQTGAKQAQLERLSRASLR